MKALEPGQALRLALISAAQIDRETAAWRRTGGKRRIAGAGLAALQKEVAVRCEPWTETGPGALEIDTVTPCGGSLSGAIVCALGATVIRSGRTEVGTVWNRGAPTTLASLRELEGALPFPITKPPWCPAPTLAQGASARRQGQASPREAGQQPKPPTPCPVRPRTWKAAEASGSARRARPDQSQDSSCREPPVGLRASRTTGCGG